MILTEKNSRLIRILNWLTNMHWSNAPDGMGGMTINQPERTP